MSRKFLLFLLVFILLSSSCLYGNIVDNKYTTSGVGNLTPVRTSYYYVGSPTYHWASGYFNNLYSNVYNVGSSSANISYNGIGQLIFSDPTSGTLTLADLATGGGANISGTGTAGRMAQWVGVTAIGDATNTDVQVSAAVAASHTSGFDTSLGIQASDLNMGGNDITNVGTVDGVDITTLGTGNVTGSGSVNRLAYWDGTYTLGDSNIYFDIPQGYYGIGTTTPDTLLQIHDGSGANQLQLSYTEGSIYTNITSNHMGYLLLNPTGDRAVLSGNLSVNTHYINNVVDPSVAQDAATKNYVDTAIAGMPAMSGNVTTSGGTANYIPKFTSSTNINNSSIQDSGTVVTMATNITMGTHYINAVADPSAAQDAATKNYVDTLASIPLANVHTVAKSGGDHTSIQTAINHAATFANSTNPQLVRIAPGIYDESITLVSYVHLASVGGSYGSVIIQQTDADICKLPSGVNNFSGITFRLVTPTAARTVFSDAGNTTFCYLDNCVIQITTPSTYAHKLISIGGTGSVLVLNNFYSSVGGTGASVGINITSVAVVTSSGMELSFTNANAFNMACSAAATVSMMNSVLSGTSSLFNVTAGTFQWTGCRLTATGTGVVNSNTTHYAENCFINSGVYAQDGSEVRLRNCSYKYVFRVGTGNIFDTSRKLQSGIFHVVDYTWNTGISYANVYVRKSGTGDVQTGGSGQGVVGTRMNSLSYAAVENNADVTGGLDSSFNCTRSIRMHQTFSVNQLHANGKMFIGVRQTVGNAIPTVTGAENFAGISWNGTAFRAVSSNGGGTGQFTVLSSPVLSEQHSFEMEIVGSKRVDFYEDGVLVASHTNAAGLPSSMVDWQRIITSDGGGDSTYMYLTLRNGFIEECPK